MNQGKVLAVEDTLESLQLLVETLTAADYQVLPANSGELALAVLDKQQPDIVLLDLRMPGIDGLEVLRHLKANDQTRNIPVIILSAAVETEQRLTALRLGAVDFIGKPFLQDELLLKVKLHVELRHAQCQLEQQAEHLSQLNYQLALEVAEHKQAKQHLTNALEQAKLLSSALDQVNAYVYMKDSNGRYFYANKPTLELFGCTAEHLMGRDDSQFFPDYAVSQIQGIDQRVFSGEKTIEEIITATDAGKQRVYLEIKTPIYTDTQPGALIGLCGISTDITERKHLEKEQLLRARRTEDLLKLSTIENMGEKDFMQFGLDLVEKLTQSQIGFIHFIHDDQETIELATWSKATLDHYCSAVFDDHYPISQAGIWADAVRNKKPVVVNDYATSPNKCGLPEGHAHLQRLISVPIMDGGRVRMMTSVANKPNDYTEFDVESLQLFTNTLWHILSRRRAEKILLNNEQRLTMALESGHLGSFDWDIVNDKIIGGGWFERLCGFVPGEFTGSYQELVERVHAEDVFTVESELKRCMDTGDTFNREFRLVWPNGSEHWLVVMGEIIFDDDRKPKNMYGTVIDITEKKQDEILLRKLSLVVEQSPESIVITNVDAEIEYVNQAFIDVTGYSPEEVIGQNPRVLHSGKTPAERYFKMWDTLTQGRVWQGEFCNKRKDGSEYLEFAILAPLRQADGTITHYVAIKEDITEKKRIGEELDQYRHHLETLVETRTTQLENARIQAEAANVAKSAFLSNISHEIRTPLNAILGLTYLMRREEMVPRQLDRLNKIQNAGRHLMALINDVLDLSKIEAGKLKLDNSDFHISSLLDYVVSMISDEVNSKRLKLEVDNVDVPPWLYGDVTRLRQALLNYASNAVKFTEHGRITLRTRVLENVDEAYLVRFEVMDTGIGIPNDSLMQMFEAFEQADLSITRRYGGSGLGLAITRQIARQMGGEVGVESQVGQGSLFWFTARLSLGQSKEASPLLNLPESEAQIKSRHGNARLLLVEDNLINREVAVELLQTVGLQVDTAENGLKAVEMARHQIYDLVLMDIHMPEMDGLQATRLMRSLPGWEDVPILAMTAGAFEHDHQACEMAGMNGFVTKPIEPERLYQTIMAFLPVHIQTSLTNENSTNTNQAFSEAEAHVLQALQTLPQLNVKRAMRILQQNLRTYRALLKTFAQQHGNDALQIKQLLQSGDMAQVQMIAHRLKGVAGTLGADQIAEWAAQIETAVSATQPPDGWQQAVTGLFDSLSELIQHIRQLPDLPILPNENGMDEAALIQELKRLLQESNALAHTLAHQYPVTLQGYLQTDYEGFIHSVDAFDFSHALNLLGQHAVD